MRFSGILYWGIGICGLLGQASAQAPHVLEWFELNVPYFTAHFAQQHRIRSATYYDYAEFRAEDSLRRLAAQGNSLVIAKEPSKVIEILFNRAGSPTDIIAYLSDRDPDELDWHFKYDYNADNCRVAERMGESRLPEVPWKELGVLRFHCDAAGRNDTLEANDFFGALFGGGRYLADVHHFDVRGRLVLKAHFSRSWDASGPLERYSVDSLVYDARGRLHREYSRGKGEAYRLTEEYRYGAGDLLLEERLMLPKYRSTTYWKYNRRGLPVRQRMVSNGKVRNVTDIAYDAQGLMTRFRARFPGDDPPMDFAVVYEFFE